MAADDIAFDPDTKSKLANCRAIEDEIVLLHELIQQKYVQVRSELGDETACAPVLKLKLSINVKQLFYQALHRPGSAVTRMTAEMRSPLNRFVTLFLGDVFTYLSTRGSAIKPGPIPLMLLEHLSRCHANKLVRQNEPLIVLSHSMGGQLVYDVITHFLPRMPEYSDIKIDFWCATASQVGFFEELKLFLESSPGNTSEKSAIVPFPNRHHLAYWWNVWDNSDLISYSAKDIFEDVDDESFDTGLFVTEAHSRYLCLPSFYRHFALKIGSAKSAVQSPN